MRNRRLFLAIGLAACLTLPVMAQTPLTPENTKVTNTIGTQGVDTAFNGKGNASFTGGVWEVNGGGEGLWTANEGVTLVTTALSGDGNITARLLDEKGGSGDGWMRSGVMIRESDDADAAVAGVFTANEDSATPRGRHIHAHWRHEKGGDHVWSGDVGPWGPEGGRPPTDGGIGLRYFPLWLRVQRVGDQILTFRSDDGRLWEQTTQTQNMTLPATTRAGLFVSSNGGEVFGTTHFDNVTIGPQVLRPGPVGLQATAGDAQVLLSWTAAPGADSHNVYRRIDGEKEFTKLTAEPTKATTYTDSTASNGKIARYLVTGLISNVETAATLQAVAAPNPAITIASRPFFTHNVDTKSMGTTELTGDGQLVVTASGAGIARGEWGGTFDSFRYIATQVDGNITLTAQITEKVTSTQDRNDAHGDHQNGGVALMVREGLAANARFAAVRATVGNGVQLRARSEPTTSPDVAEDGTDADTTKYPLYLRIQRAGDVIRGFQSEDGKTFTQVGSDVTLTGLRAPVYVGFAVTNGFEGFNLTTKIDAKGITIE
jgi:hypothetical protein